MKQELEKETEWAWRIIKSNEEILNLENDLLNQFHNKVMSRIQAEIKNPANKEKWYWKKDKTWTELK